MIDKTPIDNNLKKELDNFFSNPAIDIITDPKVIKEVIDNMEQLKEKPISQVQESVRALYKQILQREPDKEGYVHYTNMIKYGKLAEEELAKILIESDEYKNITSKINTMPQ